MAENKSCETCNFEMNCALNRAYWKSECGWQPKSEVKCVNSEQKDVPTFATDSTDSPYKVNPYRSGKASTESKEIMPLSCLNRDYVCTLDHSCICCPVKVQLDADQKVLETALFLAHQILEVALHGDFSNGNIAEGLDEGSVLANRRLNELEGLLNKFLFNSPMFATAEGLKAQEGK